MSLTVEQFRTGVRYWPDEKPQWPRDFHNDYYQKLPPANGVFDIAWWDQFYPPAGHRKRLYFPIKKVGSRCNVTEPYVIDKSSTPLATP
jgi:hypothetical protein